MGSPIPLCPKDCTPLPDPENFDTQYFYIFIVELFTMPKKLLPELGFPTDRPLFPSG